MENINLTALSKTAGCAAKISPHILAEALRGLDASRRDPNLLVGFETSDDAAVYKLTDDIAVVSTLDFFTPVADDGYSFGQVAAANALSDIYAMGGVPIYALNIVCFPAGLDPLILGEILRGGLDKIKEAGCSLVGGHSINDDVPKYGLSVTGVINPSKIMKNNNLKMNQDIFLTKPIGAGTINTAVKGGLATKSQIDEVISSMSKLNCYPEDMLSKFSIAAMTDVTGFGLIGHLSEMAAGCGCSVFLDSGKVPLMGGVLDYAKQGVLPAGLYRNKAYYSKFTQLLYEDFVKTPLYDMLFDPQTSGGLLIAVDKSESTVFENYLKQNNFISSSKIAKTIEKQDKEIIIG